MIVLTFRNIGINHCWQQKLALTKRINMLKLERKVPVNQRGFLRVFPLNLDPKILKKTVTSLWYSLINVG